MAPNRDTTPGFPARNAACFTIPLLAPDALGGAIPANDPYETNFTIGQRNIFRPAWQQRMDVSFVKNASVTERVNLKFSFDGFNIQQHSQLRCAHRPRYAKPVLQRLPHGWNPASPTACGGSNPGCYHCPYGLGNVNKTIGSARQIQFSIHLYSPHFSERTPVL